MLPGKLTLTLPLTVTLALTFVLPLMYIVEAPIAGVITDTVILTVFGSPESVISISPLMVGGLGKSNIKIEEVAPDEAAVKLP